LRSQNDGSRSYPRGNGCRASSFVRSQHSTSASDLQDMYASARMYGEIVLRCGKRNTQTHLKHVFSTYYPGVALPDDDDEFRRILKNTFFQYLVSESLVKYLLQAFHSFDDEMIGGQEIEREIQKAFVILLQACTKDRRTIMLVMHVNPNFIREVPLAKLQTMYASARMYGEVALRCGKRNNTEHLEHVYSAHYPSFPIPNKDDEIRRILKETFFKKLVAESF
jgi:hypothetical protein